MDNLEHWKAIWSIQQGVERIEAKVDELADREQQPSDNNRLWMILAAVGVALLVPSEKQAAILALLK